MTSLREFNARAELCRHFAKLEPQTSSIWLAEGERWSRLTRCISGPITQEREVSQGTESNLICLSTSERW